MKPLRISVWSPKGGTGKTTLTLNLAGLLASQGQTVQVVDLDPNAGALTWASLAQAQGRATAFPVGRAETRGTFDVVLFDHPPVNEPRLSGDVLVLPTLLDAASFRGYQDGQLVATRQGRPVFPVANRFRSDRADQRLTLSGLLPDDTVVLRDRAVFATAYSRGQTLSDPGLRWARLALAELEPLTRALSQHRWARPYPSHRSDAHALA